MTRDLRQVVLDALSRLSCPLDFRDLAVYAATFYGMDVSDGDLKALQEEERKQYLAKEEHEIWICPAIVDHPGYPADEKLLTRSDWQLEGRVLGRSSEAVRQVWLIRRLCSLLKVALQEHRPNVQPLMNHIALRADLLLPSGIVEAQLRRYRAEGSTEQIVDGLPFLEWLRFTVWEEVAEDAHVLLASVDDQLRQGIADDLSQMSQEIQLFGSTPES